MRGATAVSDTMYAVTRPTTRIEVDALERVCSCVFWYDSLAEKRPLKPSSETEPDTDASTSSDCWYSEVDVTIETSAENELAGALIMSTSSGAMPEPSGSSAALV
jgi:hypothetical protein